MAGGSKEFKPQGQAPLRNDSQLLNTLTSFHFSCKHTGIKLVVLKMPITWAIKIVVNVKYQLHIFVHDIC